MLKKLSLFLFKSSSQICNSSAKVVVYGGGTEKCVTLHIVGPTGK